MAVPPEPKLRFEDFQDAAEWRLEPLNKLAATVCEKVGTTICVPMSITTGVGLVSQVEKFGRSIAGDSYKNYIRLQRNDFAYNKSATKEFPQGYIARFSGTENAAVPASIFTCFRPNLEFVIPEFLDHLFHGNHHGRWLSKFITVGARAHGSLSVSDDDLMSMLIPVPPTKAEQQKIADCLSSLDDLIKAESQKLRALDQYRKGLMQQVFPRSGETVPRLRFPEFQDAGEWATEKLGELCSLYQPEMLATSQLSNSGKYLVYGANGVIGTYDSYNHEEDEVAVTCRGATCGEVTRTQPTSWITGNAMVVKPKDGRVSKDFVYHSLKNDGLKSVISGSAQPQITRAGFSPFVFSYSRIEEEQRRISDLLSSSDLIIDSQSQRIETLKHYKRGLLQQLFPALEVSEQ